MSPDGLQQEINYVPLQGEGIEGYELGPTLGAGVVGASYLGRRAADHTPVVIKSLSQNFAAYPQHLQGILQDVRGWIGFQHPSALMVHAVGSAHGRSIVVYEHSPGKTLDRVLAERGRLPPRDASEVIRGLAQLLAAIHEQGRRVGDLRSRKVFLEGGRGRMSDVGLAKAACLASGFGSLGFGFGHPEYLAPEVLRSDPHNPTAASDVYALGILYYELVCGQRPFTGEPAQVLRQHHEAPLPTPPPGAQISAAVAGIMMRMVAKRPQDRMGATQVVNALEQLLGGQSVQISMSAPAPIPMVTRDEWVAAQPRTAAISGRWSAEKIDTLESVGPQLDFNASLRINASEMGNILQAELDQSSASKARVQLRGKLGRGAAGTVYEGTAPGHEGPVALKILSRMFDQHRDLHERILGTLRAATVLRHPRVVPVLEVRKNASTTGERDLIVMERASGETLRAVLQREGRMTIQRANEIVADLAEALEAAEAKGLAHGDLRPEKVYVAPDGHARLADFGFAIASCLAAGLGKLGLPYGHPDYLPPEVLQEGRREPDAAGDLYSLGILFYELLTGRPPFHSADPKETLRAHLRQPMPPPPDDVALPKVYADVLMKMTAKKPRERYASANELRQALVMCLDASQSGDSPLLEVEQLTLDNDESGFSNDAWKEMQASISRPEGDWNAEILEKAAAENAGPAKFNTSAEGLREVATAALPPLRAGGRAAPPSMLLPGLVVTGLVLGIIGIVVGVMPKAPKKIVRIDVPVGADPEEEARKEQEKKTAEAIAAKRKEVQDHIDGKRFKEAFASARQAAEASEVKMQRAGERLLKQVERAAAGRAKEIQILVPQRLEEGKLKEAREVVEVFAGWSKDEALVTRLREEIRKESDAALGRDLSIDREFDVAEARRELMQKLQGWKAGGQLFKGGGVILRYRDGADLAADMRSARGPSFTKDRAPIPGRPHALRLSAERGKPAVLVLSGLPLASLSGARVEVVLAKEPAAGAQVVLLAGSDNAGEQGAGFAFGVIPVELGQRRLSHKATATLPTIPARAPIGIELTLTRGERERLGGALKIGSKDAIPAAGSLSAPTKGLLAIYVEDAEVWITSLEVRGLLDVDRILR